MSRVTLGLREHAGGELALVAVRPRLPRDSPRPPGRHPGGRRATAWRMCDRRSPGTVGAVDRPRLESRRFLTAAWRNVLGVTYAADAALLEPLLPPGVELDTLDGSPRVSLVAFGFRSTRLRGVPLPFHVNLPEATCVRVRGERAVVFTREFVPRPAISAARAATTSRIRSGRCTRCATCASTSTSHRCTARSGLSRGRAAVARDARGRIAREHHAGDRRLTGAPVAPSERPRPAPL